MYDFACSVIIPVITIWFGIFPIVVSWWAALGLTVYFVATEMVLYYVRSFKHVEALWFANLANQILFWTYVKVGSMHRHLALPSSHHIWPGRSATEIVRMCVTGLLWLLCYP